MLPKRLRLPIQKYVGPQAPRPTKTIRGELFGVRVYHTTLPYARIGVIVRKSVDKRAVVRNRIKRTIMDAVQKNIATLPVADYLFMINPAAATAQKDALEKNITKVFASLSTVTHPL